MPAQPLPAPECWLPGTRAHGPAHLIESRPENHFTRYRGRRDILPSPSPFRTANLSNVTQSSRLSLQTTCSRCRRLRIVASGARSPARLVVPDVKLSPTRRAPTRPRSSPPARSSSSRRPQLRAALGKMAPTGTSPRLWRRCRTPRAPMVPVSCPAHRCVRCRTRSRWGRMVRGPLEPVVSLEVRVTQISHHALANQCRIITNSI